MPLPGAPGTPKLLAFLQGHEAANISNHPSLTVADHLPITISNQLKSTLLVLFDESPPEMLMPQHLLEIVVPSNRLQSRAGCTVLGSSWLFMLLIILRYLDPF